MAAGWGHGQPVDGDSLGVAGADIEGLAMLTCEILTGVGPQDAPFTHVELPAGFVEVIQRATDPDPARRFERVADYVHSLAPVLRRRRRVRCPPNPLTSRHAQSVQGAAGIPARRTLLTSSVGTMSSKS